MNPTFLSNGRRLLLAAAMVVCPATVIYSQAPVDPPATRQGMQIRGPDAGQQPALPSIVAEQRSFVLQGVVVAGLFGGAVWAVCHSSRRL